MSQTNTIEQKMPQTNTIKKMIPQTNTIRQSLLRTSRLPGTSFLRKPFPLRNRRLSPGEIQISPLPVLRYLKNPYTKP